MAAGSDAIWAVDLGNCSLKALHLVALGEAVQVVGFDHIPHGKVLSSSVNAAEREELIAITLRQFVQRNEIEDDALSISVPSQNSFARFVTLPPVDAKKIPEIVQFEAAQQIPFDISEVQWSWQLMSGEDSPERRVGIIATKKEVVRSTLDQYEREDLQVTHVQMASMALYNFLHFDRPDLVNSDKRATVIINIGAESTDLVVCTASNVWQRCIVMGGNAFTQAIADTFKLNFEKAEKLKRTAPVSKYARQIFQAMRPIFTDWTGEIQRSLGFYTGSNPDVKIARVVGMGGGTKLRGLLKYLSQTLQIPVEKPDTFKRLALAPGLSSAKFHESVADFGVVYGLGLQGVGMARIESNLLPASVARSMAWAGKMRVFLAAAIVFLAVSLLCLGRVGCDRISYARAEPNRSRAMPIVARAERLMRGGDNIEQQETTLDDRVRKQVERFEYRDTVPGLYQLLISALPNAKNDPNHKELHEAFTAGDVEAVRAVPRKERRQLFITHMSVYYSDNLETAPFNKTAMMRRDQMMEMAEGAEVEGAYGRDLAELEAIYGTEYLQQMGLYAEEAAKDAGFVVTIAGYSPYEFYENLLDPMDVGMEPSDKWGLVTRIEHLDRFLGLDPNSMPLQLYSRAAEHFVWEKGPVDLDEDMPAGIGEIQIIPDTTAAGPAATTTVTAFGATQSQSGKQILIDPMTREPIGAEVVMDASGHPAIDPATGKELLNERDHWFTLQFKLIWTGGPAGGSTGGPTAGGW